MRTLCCEQDILSKANKVSAIHKKRFLVELFSCFSCVLSIFFDQYGSFVPGVTCGELFLILSSALLFLFYGVSYREKWFLFVLFYAISLASTIVSVSMSFVLRGNPFVLEDGFEIASRWVRYLSYLLFFVFFFGSSCKSISSSSLRIYRLLSLIVGAYALLQFAIYYLTKYYLPINILPIPFSNGVTTETAISTASKYSISYFRAYGIFTEPSYLAKFLLPSVALSFFGWGRQKADLISLFVSCGAIIVSTSFQGVAIVLLTFVVCFFAGLNSGSLKKKQALLIVLLFLIVFLLSLYLGLFNNVFSRFTQLGSSTMDESSSVRVFRGFAVWKELPIFYKVFGVGMGNAANSIKSLGIVTRFDASAQDALSFAYMNGMALTMVECGLIPFALLLCILFSSFKKTNWAGKVILIQLLLLMVTSNVGLLSIVSFFYFLFVLFFTKDDKKRFVV